MRRIALITALLAMLMLMLPAGAHALTRTTQLLSSPGPGAFASPASAFYEGASADGRRVFFNTSDNLVPADTDGKQDVYERAGNTITLISVPAPGASGSGDQNQTFAGVSKDGSRVFWTSSEKLTLDDADTTKDVFERHAGVTTLISKEGAGASGAGADVDFEGASSDGTHVVLSTDQNLASPDSDGTFDLYERAGGVTRMVSAPDGANSGSGLPTFQKISADGGRIIFTSTRKLTTDATTFTNVYERSGGHTLLLSKPEGVPTPLNNADYAGASDDGLHVFFTSPAAFTSTDKDATLDVFERFGGHTNLVSAAGTASGPPAAASYDGNTPDGSHVYFHTTEQLSTLDGDATADVYERAGGTTTLVSAAGPDAQPSGAGGAVFAGVSSDGRHVFFTSAQPLVAADNDAQTDVYDHSGGVTRLVSGRNPDVPAAAPSNGVFFSATNSDGSRVLLRTDDRLASVDVDQNLDVYESSAGSQHLLSARGAGASGSSALDATFKGASVDLTRVIFVTTERLLGSDVDSAFDLYAAADDVAPDTSITGGPPAVTRDDTPGFRFAATESDSTFRCRLDSGAFNPCGSPKTLGHTGEGKHTFTVFAVDAAGNVDFSPASRTFTIDRHVTLRLGGRRSQHVGRRRLVAVTVRCPQERCSVRVSARGAKPVRVSLRANRAKTVRLKLRHAPRRGHSARVKVSAAARDGAGNTATKRMNVTVRR